jgi:hypothetical protein
MSHEDLFTDAPCVQPLGRDDVVKGPNGDGELTGCFLAVIQETGFHGKIRSESLFMSAKGQKVFEKYQSLCKF